jgi:hypothetical protein
MKEKKCREGQKIENFPLTYINPVKIKKVRLRTLILRIKMEHFYKCRDKKI